MTMTILALVNIGLWLAGFTTSDPTMKVLLYSFPAGSAAGFGIGHLYIAWRYREWS